MLEDNGIGRPETIIHFPINNQLILTLYDKANYLFQSQSIHELDGKILFLKNQDNNYISRINKFQYEQSLQHVFFYPNNNNIKHEERNG